MNIPRAVRTQYLGPPGSFSHQAAKLLAPNNSVLEPISNVREIIQNIEQDSSLYGVVPIENSVDGEVTAHIDEIVFNTSKALVLAEAVVAVTFNAYCINPDIRPRVAISHPVALAQCQRFITELKLTSKTAESTSGACADLSRSQEPGAIALASAMAGPIYNLKLYKENVQDNHDAHTKFYLISQHLRRSNSNFSKTWIALVPPSNRTGVLADILSGFAERKISIHSISSRPLKSQIGAYCFHLLFEGFITDSQSIAAIGDLLRLGCSMRVLGSFDAWAGRGVLPSIFSLGGMAPETEAGFTKTLQELRFVD